MQVRRDSYSVAIRPICSSSFLTIWNTLPSGLTGHGLLWPLNLGSITSLRLSVTAPELIVSSVRMFDKNYLGNFIAKLDPASPSACNLQADPTSARHGVHLRSDSAPRQNDAAHHAAQTLADEKARHSWRHNKGRHQSRVQHKTPYNGRSCADRRKSPKRPLGNRHLAIAWSVYVSSFAIPLLCQPLADARRFELAIKSVRVTRAVQSEAVSDHVSIQIDRG